MNEKIQRELERTIEAEYERAKAAFEQAKANLERMERVWSAYKGENPTPIRPGRELPKILAGGKRMTKKEILAALKEVGFSATYEDREISKILAANLRSGLLGVDGDHYYLRSESTKGPVQ